MRRPQNDEIANLLDRVADLLEAQHASIYRVRAYRAGAATVRKSETALAERLGRDEDDELETLPSIGKSIAAAIREFATSGRLRLLERLEGQTSPHDLFSTVPGIGKALARRIEADLQIETLEDLEAAAHDGRLESVSGFGPRRARAVRESLGNLLRFSASGRARSIASHDADDLTPPVALLLEVDRIYRRRAQQGILRVITPRRFNPEHRAWLPVLHEDRDGWSLTAMFSNTARAHRLGRTHDWVVIYFERDGIDGQFTVVAEYTGDQKGLRIVRGREAECEQYYQEKGQTVSK